MQTMTADEKPKEDTKEATTTTTANDAPEKVKPAVVSVVKKRKRKRRSGDYILGPYGGAYSAGSKRKPKRAYQVRSGPCPYNR